MKLQRHIRRTARLQLKQSTRAGRAWQASATILAATIALGISNGSAQSPQPAQLPDPKQADVAVQGYVYEPAKLEPSEETVRRLRVPPGFQVTVFARDLGRPRMLAVADDGAVYVSRREQGDLLLVRDRDADGRSDETRMVARRPKLHGIAIHGRRIYVETVTDVYVAELAPDGGLGELKRIIADLPDAGQHPNRTLAVGPDQRLYLSVGSTCNACAESSPESAALLRSTLDGQSRTIYATGLRNTIGFSWHPRTGELWGMDQGIDWLGNDDQREELNRIEQGQQYGWPYIYADGKQNPQDDPPGGMSMAQWDSISRRPSLTYTAHAASMQMAFYDAAMFPAEYRGDAFVAMRGSWNRKPPAGYEIVRVRFRDGQPVAIEPFLTGFLQQRGAKHAHLGRPAGLAVAKDGALLFTDDENGLIYRVGYAAGGAAAPRTPGDSAVAPPSPADSTKLTPEPEPKREPALASTRPETATNVRLRVVSAQIKAGGAIPRAHSAYGQDVSPALRWTGAPDGTRSFAILMEDPDAREPKPFVHWVAYDIPADTTGLPIGVPTDPRLEAPAKGMLQGRNDRGSIGYFGPKPPVGDRPHRYHFQIFALDALLSLPPAASREQVLKAMQGHVLARGELIGTFAQRTPPTLP